MVLDRQDSPSLKRRLHQVEDTDLVDYLKQEFEALRASNKVLHSKLDDAIEKIGKLRDAQEKSNKKLSQLCHLKQNVSLSINLIKSIHD